MGRTIADALIAKGRREGRREVRQQILLDLLRERFGKVPQDTVAAIQSSKSNQKLNTWLRRFATATTLEEIGIRG
jgi:hypothetical protein